MDPLTVLSDIWAISHTEPAPAKAARPSAIGQAPAGSASLIFRGIISSSRSQAHRPRHLGGKQNRTAVLVPDPSRYRECQERQGVGLRNQA